MSKFKSTYIAIFCILVLSGFLRFYKLEYIPTGFHQDEVSQAYNAFSILKTGNDRYGEAYPILFRSFGSYQPPIYTYLAPIPIYIFGNTIFSARFISAISGVLIVLMTYLIVKRLAETKQGHRLSLMSAFIVAISPWSIHFSRRVVEGNLGLFFFLLALYFSILSLKKIKYFPISTLVLGISTHAYYSERLISLIFLPLFVFIFRNVFLKNKKWLFLGIIVFCLTQVPHVITLSSGAFGRRFDQVSYFNNEAVGVSKPLYLTGEFAKHYITYLSPKNLFSDTGSNLGRVSPNLGVFYSWFFVPFLLGLYFFVKGGKTELVKLIVPLGLIALVPAALTGDVFYPLRTLEFLWCIGIIISIGIVWLYDYVKSKRLKNVAFLLLITYSLFSFYVSYFVLFKHETTEHLGASYIKLVGYLDDFQDKKVIVDSSRDLAAGLRIAYFKNYNPYKLQDVLRPQLSTNYYSPKVDIEEVYAIDNIEARPIDWRKDSCEANAIIVGDYLAISPEQVKEHRLRLEFEVKGTSDNVVLSGYATNPGTTCI